MLLPFGEDGPDWASYRALLDRTWSAGLTPAVNMDTGYVSLLTPAERARALGEASDVASGRPFVAGAFIDDVAGPPAGRYRREVDLIRARGGTPILFPCADLAGADERDARAVYREVALAGPPLLAFELSPVFAPSGRVYSLPFVRELMELPAFVGLKHSSLDRVLEWARVELRDRTRPEFRIYTGNDLAIDMAFYGSDYLLGLSAFSVEGFAARDRLWAACDPRAMAVNDALQALGSLAFRAPVPAYKHSAAQFLHLRGVIPRARPHPRCPRRPDSDLPLLEAAADRLALALADAS